MPKSIDASDRSSKTTDSTDDLVLFAECDFACVEDNFSSFDSRTVPIGLSSIEKFPVYNANNGMLVQSCFDDSGDANNEDQDVDQIAVDDVIDAENIVTSEACNVSHSVIRSRTFSDSVLQELDGMSRPFLIYIQVIKESPKSAVGISFTTKRIRSGDDTKCLVVVNKVLDAGLFGRSSGFCLQSGDEVLSVCNRSAIGLKAAQVANLLKSAPDTISLTVRNPSGDPRIVLSSVQKPSATSMVGVALINKCHGHALYVSRVDGEGLFAGSLLMPGHQCMMINGVSCRNIPSDEAVKIIHAAPNPEITDPELAKLHVRILSRLTSKQSCYATVLSSDEDKRQWKQKVLNKLGFQKLISVALNASNTEIVAIATAVEGNETKQSRAKLISSFCTRVRSRT